MLVRTGAARCCFACFASARFPFALARPFYACPLVFARLRFRPCVFLLLRLPILDSTRPDSIRLDSIHSTHSIRHDLSRFDWIRFESTKGRTASTSGFNKARCCRQMLRCTSGPLSLHCFRGVWDAYFLILPADLCVDSCVNAYTSIAHRRRLDSQLSQLKSAVVERHGEAKNGQAWRGGREGFEAGEMPPGGRSATWWNRAHRGSLGAIGCKRLLRDQVLRRFLPGRQGRGRPGPQGRG